MRNWTLFLDLVDHIEALYKKVRIGTWSQSPELDLQLKESTGFGFFFFFSFERVQITRLLNFQTLIHGGIPRVQNFKWNPDFRWQVFPMASKTWPPSKFCVSGNALEDVAGFGHHTTSSTTSPLVFVLYIFPSTQTRGLA